MVAPQPKRTLSEGYRAVHPSLRRNCLDVTGLMQANGTYSQAYLASVRHVHQQPRKWYERLAWWWLLAVRTCVGLLTGTLRRQANSERQLARRAQMFNCDGQATALAAVMVNHARSVLLCAPDNGWVHTLLEEVDCMRCQYAIWAELMPPSLPERCFDLALTANLFLQCCLVYVLAPPVIHSYQVYRAEEDIWWLTYTLTKLESPGNLPTWSNRPAPPTAHVYYWLQHEASVRDVLLRMRADEASIRHINHRMAGLRPGSRIDAVALKQFAG